MADHIYEIGLPKTTGAAAGPIVTIVPGTLGAGIRPPEIREIGIFSNTGVAAEVGIGFPAAVGTGTITGATVLPLMQTDPAGHTQLVTSFATLQPTAPANYYRRAQLQTIVGGGVIFTWLPDEWMLWSGATIPQIVIWQISALAVTYDVYLKTVE